MAFAGDWYPAGRAACERRILDYWSEPLPTDLGPARLGVVPHAGWAFSGRLAARVFQALAPPEEVALVIVMGGHLREGDPVVAMVEGSWETPFGPFALHSGFRAGLEALPGVVFESERRHHRDNSTELQLPFAKLKYPRAELLALRAPPSGVALELGRRLGDYLERTGLAAVAVASTDLTHYGPDYGFEPRGRGSAALAWVSGENDPAFQAAVATGRGLQVLESAAGRQNACSAGAVAALCELAGAPPFRGAGLTFRPLGYATSADVHPADLRNFVGYLAGVFA
jgi:hypothetical protein